MLIELDHNDTFLQKNNYVMVLSVFVHVNKGKIQRRFKDFQGHIFGKFKD